MSFSASSLHFKKAFSNLGKRNDLIHIYYIWIWILQ